MDVMELAAKDMAQLIELANTNQKTIMPVVNVKGYGAKGDGVTDDVAAFQQAVTDLTASGGGILFIPPGQYVLSSPIVIANTDIVIDGAGVQLTQLFFTGSSGIVYSSTNLFSDCIQIRNLSLITTTDNLYNGIDISFPSNQGSPWRNTIIENVTLSGTTSVSAYNDGSNNSQTGAQNWLNAIHVNDSAVSVIRDCVIRAGASGTTQSGGNGILIEGYTVDILIQGCKFYSADIGVKKTGPGEGIIIDNCMFVNVDYGVNLNQGASALAGVYASIQNCHFNYCNSGIIASYQPQITIQNCLCYKQSAATGGSDINLNYCDRSKIISNTCLVNTGGGLSNGIVIGNSINCVIDDNIVEERDTGIWLQSGANNGRQFGNRVSGNNTNYLDQGAGNYRAKLNYEASIVLTPSGTTFNADIALPGVFSDKPSSGFMMSASSGEDILGFYDYDSASTTSTNARFKLVKRDGTAFSGVPTRFNVILYE